MDWSLDPFSYPTRGVTIIIPVSQTRKLTGRSNLLKVTLLVMAELEFEFRSAWLEITSTLTSFGARVSEVRTANSPGGQVPGAKCQVSGKRGCRASETPPSASGPAGSVSSVGRSAHPLRPASGPTEALDRETNTGRVG